MVEESSGQNDHAQQRRAWKPEQKLEVLEHLWDFWMMNPDSRLGQLLLNTMQSDQSLYYIEDYDLLDCLQRYVDLERQVTDRLLLPFQKSYTLEYETPTAYTVS